MLNELGETKTVVLARRSAKARAMTGPVLGRLLERNGRQPERPRVEGDPRMDTRAAAAHLVGVLWASASQGLSVKELRAAVGISRERLEDAYAFLGQNPPLGLAVQRHGDELRLVTSPEVTASVERHRNHPRPVALSQAALEVLAIVAYRQPIAHTGVEFIRGSASDSALETLLQRGLIEHNAHHLLVTTKGFLDFIGLRDQAVECGVQGLSGLVLEGWPAGIISDKGAPQPNGPVHQRIPRGTFSRRTGVAVQPPYGGDHRSSVLDVVRGARHVVFVEVFGVGRAPVLPRLLLFLQGFQQTLHAANPMLGALEHLGAPRQAIPRADRHIRQRAGLFSGEWRAGRQPVENRLACERTLAQRQEPKQ